MAQKNTEVRKLNDAELRTLVAQKREELRSFRFGGAGGRKRDVRAGRTARKEIARMLTETRAREIASSPKKA